MSSRRLQRSWQNSLWHRGITALRRDRANIDCNRLHGKEGLRQRCTRSTTHHGRADCSTLRGKPCQSAKYCGQACWAAALRCQGVAVESWPSSQTIECPLSQDRHQRGARLRRPRFGNSDKERTHHCSKRRRPCPWWVQARAVKVRRPRLLIIKRSGRHEAVGTRMQIAADSSSLICALPSQHNCHFVGSLSPRSNGLFS